ncbi:MAG: hypothetical protein ACRDU5_18990 [Mycobacterium sp.]
MDDRNRLLRSVVAPVRAMLDRRRLAEHRAPTPLGPKGVPREPRGASPACPPHGN